MTDKISYLLPLISNALLHPDLINVGLSWDVPLSGHDDVALFDLTSPMTPNRHKNR